MTKRICPICKWGVMKPNGKIRLGGCGRLRIVYMCNRCGYKRVYGGGE